MREEKLSRKKYWCVYTIVFLIVFFFAFLQIILQNEKSLIASYDSLDQHYIGFIYVGKWARNFIKALVFEKHLNFAMWDVSIGYGSDVFSTLAVYFGDPFCWLSTFVPLRYSELVFSIIIIIKIYLCGITFSYLCLEKGNSNKATLCGAIIYTFAGSIYVGLLQTIFLSVMYLFPLVILGADRLWAKRKWGLYVFSLSLTFITYFYFAYMVCILVFGYCNLLLITDDSFEKKWTNVINKICDFLLFSILSFTSSMFLTFPVLLGFFDAERLETDYYVPLLYDLNRYKDFLAKIFDWQWVGMDSYIGIAAISAPCLIALFLVRKKYQKYKVMFITLTAGVLVPFFGYALNGFGYVTNRWSWAYSMCIAYIVVLIIPVIRDIICGKQYTLILCSLVYVFVVEVVLGYNDRETNIIVFLVLGSCFFVAFSNRLSSIQYYLGILILTCVSVISPARFFVSPSYNNYIGTLMDKGSAYLATIESSALPVLYDKGTTNIERYDQYGIPRVRNASSLHGIGGIDFYCSLYNNNIDQFHNNLGMLTSPWAYGYDGLNYRSELEALFGVKHYLVSEGMEMWLPYTYDELEAEKNIGDTNYRSYTTDKSLSLMYFFENAIDQADYEDLNPYEKQQAIMQAIAVDDAEYPVDKLNIENKPIEYNIVSSDGVDITDNDYHVDHDGAYMILEMPEVSDSEIYIWFGNISYSHGADSAYRIVADGFYGEENINGIWAGFDGLNNRNHMYGGKNDWLINLGHSSQKINRIKVVFENIGNYSIGELRIYARNKNSILRSIENLIPATNDMRILTNKIEAKVFAAKDGWILMTIPYSKGWSAYVDGERVSIEKSNDAFMGLYVSQGQHVITFYYFTPGLIIGLIVSFISMLLLWLIKRSKIKLLSFGINNYKLQEKIDYFAKEGAMLPLGFYSLVLTYFNMYGSSISQNSLFALLVFGIGYYFIIIALHAFLINGKARNIIEWLLAEMGLVILWVNVLPDNIRYFLSGICHWATDDGETLQYFVLLLLSVILAALLRSNKRKEYFCKNVGRYYFFIVVLQPFLGWFEKLWDMTLSPVQGIIRVILTLAFTNIIGRLLYNRYKTFRPVFLNSEPIVFLVIFVVAYITMFLGNTHIVELIYGTYRTYNTLVSLAICICCCLISAEYWNSKSRVLVNVYGVLLFSYLTYYVLSGDIWICAMYVLTLAAIVINSKLIVTSAFWGSILSFIFTIFISLTGIISNNVEIGNDGIKHAMGFLDANGCSMHLFFIVLMYVFTYRSSKNIDRIVKIGLVISSFCFVYFYTGGRTSAIGLLYLMIVTIVYEICVGFFKTKSIDLTPKWKVLSLIYAEGILLASVGISFLFSWIYDANREYFLLKLIGRFFDTDTIKSRLRMGNIGLHNFHPKLFGQFIFESNEEGNYFWLDNMYIRAYLKYGIIILLSFIVFTSIVYARLWVRDRHYQLLIISIIPVLGILEALVGDPMYNVFLLLALSKMESQENDLKLKECIKKVNERILGFAIDF